MVDNSFGAILKRYRIDNGIDASVIAGWMKISVRNLYDIEAGKMNYGIFEAVTYGDSYVPVESRVSFIEQLFSNEGDGIRMLAEAEVSIMSGTNKYDIN